MAETRRDGGPIAIVAVPTPIGRFYLAATSAALLAVQLPGNDSEGKLHLRLARRFPSAPRNRGVNFMLKKTAVQLGEYFTGGRRTFSIRTLPMGTPFQIAVWQEVARIPFAATRTYADIARAIHYDHAVRAVGAAQKANPFPILIPCHRVIGSNGRLVGYEGGLKLKRWLLDHEHQALKSGAASAAVETRAMATVRAYRPGAIGTVSTGSSGTV